MMRKATTTRQLERKVRELEETVKRLDEQVALMSKFVYAQPVQPWPLVPWSPLLNAGGGPRIQ
jgi:hypothetical protein